MFYGVVGGVGLKKAEALHYSGKKKCYVIKIQVVVNKVDG
jgi:hypothetical protein